MLYYILFYRSENHSKPIEKLNKIHQEEIHKITEELNTKIQDLEHTNQQLSQERTNLTIENDKMKEKIVKECGKLYDENYTLNQTVRYGFNKYMYFLTINSELTQKIQDLEQKQSIIHDKETMNLTEDDATDREDEIHKIKENFRNQVFEIKDEYTQRIKNSQAKIDQLNKENQGIF